MRTTSPEIVSKVTIPAQHFEPGLFRESLLSESSVEPIGTESHLLAMLSAISIFVMERKKLPILYSATGAFSSVGQKNFLYKFFGRPLSCLSNFFWMIFPSIATVPSRAVSTMFTALYSWHRAAMTVQTKPKFHFSSVCFPDGLFALFAKPDLAFRFTAISTQSVSFSPETFFCRPLAGKSSMIVHFRDIIIS
jgi:hypothetical protein